MLEYVLAYSSLIFSVAFDNILLCCLCCRGCLVIDVLPLVSCSS